MTALPASLLEMIASDAEAIAALLKQRRGERAQRRTARALLAKTFSLLERLESPPEATQQPKLHEALETQAELQRTHALLAAGRARGIRRIGDVWVRTPMPVRILPLWHVLRRDRMVNVLVAKGELPLALSEARVDWMEQRCQVEQAGVVRPVRSRQDEQSERLLASELELLRKRGRSRFS